jgi:hypothetical protein
VSQSNRAIPGVVVRSYDLGFPTIREVVSDNVDQDGTQDLTAFFGSRVVKLECSIHDTPGVTKHQLYETLKTMCLPGHQTQLLVQCDGWAQQRVMAMRGTPASCVVSSKHATFLEASLGWVVPSGIMRSAATNEVIVAPVSATATGRSYPKSYPWSYTPGSLTNTATITNAGPHSMPWVATFYGQTYNIAIVNQSTGEKMVLNVNLADGHFVRVDTAARTALIDGTPGNSAYGTIDFTQSTWWSVPPGSSTLSVTAASSGVASKCYFDWNSGWV